MNGAAILFMLFFWLFITALTTFCLTLIFYTSDRRKNESSSSRKYAKG